MNYISEINKFYDWLETNSVSDSSILLWHALMHINNKCGWKEEFTVAISSIQNKTGLSKSSILRARNNLQQAGRISFSSRNGNLSAVYSIAAFHTDTLSGAQTGTQTVTQTATQTVPITKLNKTKLNKTLGISDKSPPSKSFKNFTENEFKEEIRIYKNDFDGLLLNKFYEYWKEKSAGGKMKFQLEKTWETKLRLARWKANGAKFQNSKYNNEKNRTGAGVKISSQADYSESL